MARAWHLKSRPNGMPTSENFELKDIDLPELGEGQGGWREDVQHYSQDASI